MKNLKSIAYKKIEATKDKLIKKAKKTGIYENFGQNEVRDMRDNLGGSPYGTEDERRIDLAIDDFNNWVMNYTGGDY